MTPRDRQHTKLSMPNGWFAVAWSKDLVPGDVKPIRYFDEELVVFRTRDGHVRVLDAYCSHLGAHLGHGGRVVGESVRCPFHGWQYDGEQGGCVKIPYCDKIPAKARVRAWPVLERNRMIFVWYHAEGAPPVWDIPTLPELDDPAWTEPRYYQLDVPVHMQDMAENNCDPVHFQYVHGMVETPDGEMEFGDDGRFFRITNTAERETPLGTFTTELERDSWQLGMTTVRTKGIPDAGLLMFSSTSAIDAEHTCSRWVFTVTRNLADAAGEDWIAALSTGVLQDMHIWGNKIYRPAPVFCEGDKYLMQFRRWTRQFYSTTS